MRDHEYATADTALDPAVSADDIAKRVTHTLGGDAVAGRESITVRVTGDDVVLSGWVTSPAQHDAAIAAAEQTPGVARVHDEIVVGDVSPRPA
jgi:osmotically-inducible protein OsmY